MNPSSQSKRHGKKVRGNDAQKWSTNETSFVTNESQKHKLENMHQQASQRIQNKNNGSLESAVRRNRQG